MLRNFGDFLAATIMGGCATYLLIWMSIVIVTNIRDENRR